MASNDRNPERVGGWHRVLAVLSTLNVLLLFTYQSFASFLPEIVAGSAIAIDLGFVLIYGLSFVGGVVRAPRRIAYVKSHWYELVGAIPIPDPMIRSLQLVRWVRIWIYAKPENLAAEERFGELAVRAILERFMGVIVRTIVNPLIVAGITVTKPIVTRIRFADIIGTTVEHTNEDIRKLVRENMARAPGVGRVMAVKPVDKTLKAAEDAAVHAVVATLRSEELNKIVQQTTGSVMDALKVGLTSATTSGAQSVARAQPPSSSGSDGQVH